MPFTFRQLKQDVAQGYKRHVFVASNTGSNGSTTIMFDTNRQEPDRFWSLDGSNVWVKFLGNSAPSLNDGVVRKVTGYSLGNSSITFAPAVTASVAASCNYQLYKGSHPDNDIGQAINETLRATFPERVVSSIATTHEIEDQRSYTVPSAASSTITKLRRVERSVGTTASEYEYNTLVEGIDYRLLDTGGATLIELQYIPTPSMLLRFTGERVASTLSADTDTTDEPPAVILAGARHFLALQEGNTELATYWERKFEDAKRDYLKSRPATPLKVPFIRAGY